LRFSKSYDFSKRICEKAENRDSLQRLLSQILGQSVQISISFVAEEAPTENRTADREPAPTAPGNAEDHPYVSRVMQVFGAQVVSVETHARPEERAAADPLEEE
jgi:hypothetical protein